MANPEHLKILKQGVEVWNKWREENPGIMTDLSEADIQNLDLRSINFIMTDLRGANLQGTLLNDADLICANFTEANLSHARLVRADIESANLEFAVLKNAMLIDADLRNACLSNSDMSYTKLGAADFASADLSNANLSRAGCFETNFRDANLANACLKGTTLIYSIMVGTNLSNAIIEDAWVYGLSAWNLKKDGLIQKNLIITPDGEPEITVDDLEVAQFIYLMLNNQKIRDVIETITSKAVLILGRFTPERKAVLDALKDELRRRNYLPIVFDFENAGSKSVDETVNLLARMSRFVVADITDAKSIPQELRGIVPDNPSVPIVPLIWAAQREYGMFDHFKKYPWVLPLHEYDSPEILLNNIIPAIIAPAEQKVAELRGK